MPPNQTSDPAAGTPSSPQTPQPSADAPRKAAKKSMEELLAEVRQLRATAHINMSAVEGQDPDHAYVWVHNSEARINSFLASGYRICKDPKVRTMWKKEDGRHIRADTILMEIDKDRHYAMQVDAELRSLEGIEAGQEEFMEWAAQRKIPVQKKKEVN